MAVGRFDLPRRRLPTHLAPCHPTCNGASRGMDDASLEYIHAAIQRKSLVSQLWFRQFHRPDN